MVPAANRFRVTQSMGDVLAVSGAMRRLAVEIGKVASDLRLLGMGPRAGIAEIRAARRAAGIVDHARQGEPVDPGDGEPGLLPGDRLRRDDRRGGGGGSARAERDDAGDRVERAARGRESSREALHILATRTIEGLEADEARCRELLDRSTAVATALSPYLGYAVTADVAKEAVATGRSIRDVVLDRGACSSRRGWMRSSRQRP